MRIVDSYYLLTSAIILLGTPLLLYIKLSQEPVRHYNVVISGEQVEAAMLAYYIDKHNTKLRINITVVSPVPPKRQLEEVEKILYSFCGDEQEYLNVLEDINMKYRIKEQAIYFSEQSVGTRAHEDTANSIFQYGLSHFAAQQFFRELSLKLYRLFKKKPTTDLGDLSVQAIFSELTENHPSSLNYFGQQLGLDQNYLEHFILPIIRANYLHDVNSLSAIFKVLPFYCKTNHVLFLFEHEDTFSRKMLEALKKVGVEQQAGYSLESVRQSDPAQGQDPCDHIMTFNGQNPNETLQLKGDLLFVFQQSIQSQKQVSYYKTIVDGLMKGRFKQFFTTYMRPGDSQQVSKILSITRVCVSNCKGFLNEAYVIISKHKLTSMDLTMFEEQTIVLYKKLYLLKSTLPLKNKLEESKQIYRLYQLNTVTDSMQAKLALFNIVGQAVIAKLQALGSCRQK